ncbi:MAG: exopolysaccharide production protein [Leifsonia xyli]|nr:MAG: exopolysaccharide production protein [Leifsonia xyli]
MRAASNYQRALAMLCFGVLAAGDFWRHLLSWWGWGALAVLVVTLAVVELVRMRVNLRRLPLSLFAFLGFMTLSISWALNPGAAALSAFGSVATTTVAALLAVSLSWQELLEVVSTTLRWILGASLLFELFVATVIRHPVLPLWIDYSTLEKIPSTFYWSRALLFEGGRIQGIVGNANTLGILSLLALIVFVSRLLARRGSPLWAWFWIAVALLAFGLTRSATVIVAAVATLYVAAVVVLARRVAGRARIAVLSGTAAVTVALIVTAFLARAPLLRLLGRSSDLTNRVDIWQIVTEYAIQRPVAGWGWGFWAPWTWPIEGFGKLNKIGYLSAHNAWLDVFLQLGAIGVVLLAVLVVGALIRSWSLAQELRSAPYGSPLISWPLSATPLLLLTALLVQSLVESQLLWEFGFALLVIIAVKTGWRDPERAEAVAG